MKICNSLFLALALLLVSSLASAVDWSHLKSLGKAQSTLTVDWKQSSFQKFEQQDGINTTLSFADPSHPDMIWLMVVAPTNGTLPTLTWPSAVSGAPPDAGAIGNVALMGFFFDGAKYTYYESAADFKYGIYSGGKPAVTTGATDCGTGPITSVGNDYAGRVTVGTSTNGGKCTLTFTTTWVTPPSCQCTNESAAQLCRAIVASNGLTVALTGTLVAGNLLTYECAGFR